MKKIVLPSALFLSCLAGTAHASKTILPDACGAGNVKFEIKQQKADAALPLPEDGKALFVFIETLEKSGVIGTPTARFGMDGAWVGATKGNAYFTVSVPPGDHHLCSNWDKKVGMASIKAEAGKTYYFQFKISLIHSGGGGSGTVMGGPAAGQPVMVNNAGHTSVSSSNLDILSDDEGKYRVKASDVSVSVPKP
jgi:hypothetical protein